MSRWWLAAAVMLAWFGALGWLVARERAAGGEARELAANARRVGPASAYYAVEVGGRQVGLATSTADTSPQGVRLAIRYDVSLPVGDSIVRMLLGERVYLTRELALQSFSTALRGGGGGALTSSGDVRYGLLDWTVAESRADTSAARFALPHGAVSRSSIPLRVAFSGRMEPGTRLDLPVIDPLGGRPWTADVRVGGDSLFTVADSAALDSATRRWSVAHQDTVRAWRIEVAGGGAPATLWVDAQGQLVEAATADGFALYRRPFDLVTQAYQPRTGAVADSAALAVPVAGALDHVPARADHLTLLLGLGDDADRWSGSALDGAGQALRGDTLAISRAGGRLASAYLLPNADTAFAPALSPDALVPSRDPAVLSQARRIAGGERRPRVVASLLTAWVARSVARDPRGSTDPIRALAVRRGDASAHATLLVAFARGLGLPARLAGGAVYDRGRWWYHSWAELWLDGWVPADPWFGTLPAEASYLRLVTDAPGRPFQVIPLLQRLAPRVLSSAETR